MRKSSLKVALLCWCVVSDTDQWITEKACEKSSCLLSFDEAFWLIFADSDSDGEYFPSEDDVRLSSDSAPAQRGGASIHNYSVQWSSTLTTLRLLMSRLYIVETSIWQMRIWTMIPGTLSQMKLICLPLNKSRFILLVYVLHIFWFVYFEGKITKTKNYINKLCNQTWPPPRDITICKFD